MKENNYNWKNIFNEKLNSNGFDQEEIARIYRLEMELRKFFDFDGLIPVSLGLENIERNDKEIVYYWRSTSTEAKCPHCETESNRYIVGDYYEKRIQDIPQSEKAVFHSVRAKLFYCGNEKCETGKFVERHYEFVDEHARKTQRFKKYCVERSLGCGCSEAEREIRAEGGIVSNDTIGRYTKEKSAEIIESHLTEHNIKVLAIDDINLRKGDKTSACTVFIDQETHKILIIIRGTTKEAVKKVMELFPESEILSRDRATSYASAGLELGKLQVADRFHVITNAQTAVKDALMAKIPASIFIREGDGWISVNKEPMDNGTKDKEPGGTDLGASFYHVPDEIIKERAKLAGLTPKKAQKYRDTMKLIELADKGLRTADIAKELCIPYKSVQALRRTAASTIMDVEKKIDEKIEKHSENKESEETIAQVPGERAVKTVGGGRNRNFSESIVEPYRETVTKLWQAGGNHRTIYPILQLEGYTGSKNAIYQYIIKLGKESPDEIARERKKDATGEDLENGFDLSCAKNRSELSIKSVARNDIYKAILKEASIQREKGKEDLLGEPLHDEPLRGEALSDEPLRGEPLPDEPLRCEPLPGTEPLDSNPPEKNKKAKCATRPASSKTSPLKEETLNIIYGQDASKEGIINEDNKKASNDQKKNLIEKFKDLFPIINILIQFLVEFYAVFDSNDISKLDSFINKYIEHDIDALNQFANGLLKDYDAVKNCLLYPEISNGPSEGCNNRIKMIHRRSGGRASLELLNAFAVLTSAGKTNPDKVS